MSTLDMDEIAPPESGLRFETIRFDWHRVYAQRVGEALRGKNLTPEQVDCEERFGLPNVLVPRLAGTSIEFRRPLDWWEAVKERWLPAWLMRRFPAKYHVATVRLSALYPSARVPASMGMPVREIVLLIPNQPDRDAWFLDVLDLRREEMTYLAARAKELLSDRESRKNAYRLCDMVSALAGAIDVYDAARKEESS